MKSHTNKDGKAGALGVDCEYMQLGEALNIDGFI